MAKNSFFRFKQFTVQQANASMKVGTDGILLGAWVDVENCKSILDVGTGTGLIALMLAQRSDAKVTAIEIEGNAAEQAKENVSQSPWKEEISVKHISLQDFVSEAPGKYDLIVSNPPFFNQSLKAADKARNQARHTCSLPFNELLDCSSRLMEENGRLALILPKTESEDLKMLAAENNLFLIRETMIRPRPGKKINRVLLEFAKQQNPIAQDELSVYAENGTAYSQEFCTLTREFYLGH